MGMAASQARFLGLTARKTNTEYEGQQVNQQRTALANESSGLFNKMLTLQVPIPPDTNNFYNMRYTYAVGGDSYEITNYVPSSTKPGTFLVSVLDSTTVSQPYEMTLATAGINRNISTNVWSITAGSLTAPLSNPPITRPTLAKEMGLDENEKFYSYKDANNQEYYISETKFNTYTAGGTADYPAGAVSQYTYKDVKQSVPKTIDGCNFISNSNGTYKQIVLPDGQGTIDLNNERVRDDIGYEAAMSDYTATKNLYDKSIADINAQTSVIQQQDRTLELRLKQLDTEQQALQTEMDSVAKVIDKNIESTFKTFA